MKNSDVIEFYEKVLWLPSMPKKESLTDNEIEQIKDTMMFDKWMLRTNTKRCVLAMKESIRQIKCRIKLFDKINKKYEKQSN